MHSMLNYLKEFAIYKGKGMTASVIFLCVTYNFLLNLSIEPKKKKKIPHIDRERIMASSSFFQYRSCNTSF